MASCASTNEPYAASSRRSRSPACRPNTAVTANPRRRSRALSSSAVNSTLWNGLTGRSSPGENVSRFGALTSSIPRGRSTRPHSRTNSPWFQTCSITCSATRVSTRAVPTGSAARFARTKPAVGYVAAAWRTVSAS